MFSWYALFKFLHVAAVIVWVGGVIALATINAYLARQRNTAALHLAAQQGIFFGTRIMLPAAALTLLAGIAMLMVSNIGMPLWTYGGLIGVFGSFALGITVLRPTGKQLAALAAEPQPDHARVATLRRRSKIAMSANVLLLLSTVALMVFKPV